MSDFTRCHTCGNLVDPALAQAGDGACPWCLAAFTFDTDPTPTPAEPSTRFGKYVRTEKLGAGGMGEVWKALDTELNRWVALKFLKDQDPKELARFQREARTAAALSHPNIGSIYEIGEAEGRSFIAMQYVAGRTLETFPRDDRRVILGLVRDAARAVDHAHRQGIIHRDLKPENLMVEKSDDGWRVVVLDFGLARHIEGGEKLSMSGDIVGTPAFMSPEQARAETLDERSDVYSLGATLYEVLTGRPPFEGPNILEVIRQVGSEEPVRPRKIDPKIHRDLETIVLKCLEKDRARRYASARELADDLERFLNLEPIVARPQSTIYRLRMTLAKRKAVAAVGLGGLLVAAWLGWQLWRSLASERTFRSESARREASLKEIGALWSRMVEAKQGLHIQPVDFAREVPQVRGRIVNVIDDVSGFIERNPSLPQGYYIRARGRMYLEDLGSAEQDLRKSVAADPSFTPGHAQLGRLLMQRHILLQMEEYKAFLGGIPDELSPGQPEPRVILKEAQEQLALGMRAPKRKESWGLTRTREDDVSDVVLEAMGLYYVEEDPRAGIGLLEKENAKEPSEEFMNWLGKWAAKAKDKVDWQTRAIARRPIFATAYYDRACASISPVIESLQAAGPGIEPEGLEPFVRDAEMALLINPGFSMLRLVLYTVYQARGRSDLAIRQLDLGTAESSGTPQARRFQGMKAFNKLYTRDHQGAIDDYTRLLEEQPNDRMVLYFRSMAHHLKGNREAAARDFEESFRGREAEIPMYYLLRGQVLQQEGRLEEAEADFRRSAEASGKDGGRTLADAAIEGIKLLRDLKKRGVNFDPQVLFQQSMGLHNDKEYRKAIVGFRRIVEEVPENPLALPSAYNIACGHALLGEKNVALDWLEKAIAMGFKDADHLQADSDLESIRGEERYRNLVQRLKTK